MTNYLLANAWLCFSLVNYQVWFITQKEFKELSDSIITIYKCVPPYFFFFLLRFYLFI